MLLIRHVDLGRRRLLQAVLTNAGDDAYDCHEAIHDVVSGFDALANRILSGEPLAGERFVHDTGELAIGIVMLVEVASTDKSYAKCVKVAGTDQHESAGLGEEITGRRIGSARN